MIVYHDVDAPKGNIIFSCINGINRKQCWSALHESSQACPSCIPWGQSYQKGYRQMKCLNVGAAKMVVRLKPCQRKWCV